MADLNLIIEKIEQFAPLELASSWDNSGWQINLGNKTVNRILLALSPTVDVVNQAIENKCDLIISHHPLIFNKLNTFSVEEQTSLALITAIQNKIQVYSAHTNLDSSQGGIADKLAGLFNLKNIVLPDYLQEESKFARIGEFETEKELDIFINEIKEKLNVQKIKLINTSNKSKIKKIMVIPGSGGSFIPKIKDVDVLITGDVKYHDALEAKNIIVIDAGHLETERIILPVIKDFLAEFAIEVFIADEKPLWDFI